MKVNDFHLFESWLKLNWVRIEKPPAAYSYWYSFDYIVAAVLSIPNFSLFNIIMLLTIWFEEDLLWICGTDMISALDSCFQPPDVFYIIY